MYPFVSVLRFGTCFVKSKCTVWQSVLSLSLIVEDNFKICLNSQVIEKKNLKIR